MWIPSEKRKCWSMVMTGSTSTWGIIFETGYCYVVGYCAVLAGLESSHGSHDEWSKMSSADQSSVPSCTFTSLLYQTCRKLHSPKKLHSVLSLYVTNGYHDRLHWACPTCFKGNSSYPHLVTSPSTTFQGTLSRMTPLNKPGRSLPPYLQ